MQHKKLIRQRPGVPPNRPAYSDPVTVGGKTRGRGTLSKDNESKSALRLRKI